MVQVEPEQTGVGFDATAFAGGATTNADKLPAHNEMTRVLNVKDRITESAFLIIRCFLVDKECWFT